MATPGLGYASSYGVYDYFPTWGVSNYSGWGLGSVASNWLYSGYTNPYYRTVVAAQPAQTTVVYDYSQPINVAAAPPDPTRRREHRAGLLGRARRLQGGRLPAGPRPDRPGPEADARTSRSSTSSAPSRCSPSSGTTRRRRSIMRCSRSGPGWNWATMVGLYPDVDTYTNQLRALEAYVRSNPNSAPGQFLLGYHYLIQGHKENAGSQFEKVAQLQPQDQLSAGLRQGAEEGVRAAGRDERGRRGTQPAGAAPAATAAAAQAQPAANPRTAGPRPRNRSRRPRRRPAWSGPGRPSRRRT